MTDIPIVEWATNHLAHAVKLVLNLVGSFGRRFP
jgi:hypothetical protein